MAQSQKTAASRRTIQLDLKESKEVRLETEGRYDTQLLPHEDNVHISETSSSDAEDAYIDIPVGQIIRQANDLEAEEDAKTGGAVLVHSLTNGKPDLDHLMDKLQEAMEKCQDPIFMQQISERFVESRRSKKITSPTNVLAGSFNSIRGSVAQ